MHALRRRHLFGRELARGAFRALVVALGREGAGVAGRACGVVVVAIKGRVLDGPRGTGAVRAPAPREDVAEARARPVAADAVVARAARPAAPRDAAGVREARRVAVFVTPLRARLARAPVEARLALAALLDPSGLLVVEQCGECQ